MSRWGEDKTLLFVTYYRSYECLWNIRSPLYKNNIARNNAYESLLKDINDPTLTVKTIKTKIKNLRSIYHSEIKKINSSRRSGAGANDVYKPLMSWFAEMASFMGDTDDYRDSVGTELESDTSSQNPQSTNAHYSNVMSPLALPTPSSIETEGVQSSTTADYSIPSTPSRSSTPGDQSRPPSRYSGRRKKKPDESVGVAEALSRLENISTSINNRKEEDEFYFFGLNVASQLRQLPLHEALDIQTEIQAILTSARRRNMYPNLTPHSSLPSSNTQTTNIQPITYSTLSSLNTQNTNVQPITYSTLSSLNTQTTNIQPITYSTLPSSNTQTNTFSASNIQQRSNVGIDLLSEAWKTS